MVIHFEIWVVYYILILYKAKKVTRLNFYFVSLFVCQSFALFSSFFVNYYAIHIIALSK